MTPGAIRATIVALCLLGHGTGGIAQAPPQASEHGATSNPDLLLVEIVINGNLRPGLFTVVRRPDGFWVRAVDLAAWRIPQPGIGPEQIDGEAMVPLAAVEGMVAEFDSARQRLDLRLGDERFDVQRLATEQGRVVPTEGAFAAFVNYDLSLAYDERVTGGAFLEAGVSDSWGLVATTALVGRANSTGQVTRLESYYLRDFPDGTTRLVVGDTVTDAREWSRQIRFGGVRIGTEFSLQPQFVTFPVPQFSDRAAVPSNVELLVNDALRYQTRVDQGPFTIDQAPIVTGAGNVTLVVRDPLGVERRVRTPYYVSSRLLRPGLSAWSFEAGAERGQYGFRSFGYGSAFAAGSYRSGITDWLTLEGRTELGENVQMTGAGANMVWPAVGEFGVSGALSHGVDGNGALYRVSFSRIATNWNIAVSYLHATQNFDQLGIDLDRDRIRDQFQATGGLSLGRWGNATLSWTDLAYADGNRTKVLSGNYNLSVSETAYLNFFTFRTRTDDARWNTTAGLGLTVALGPQTSAYAQADRSTVMAELRMTSPTDGGLGYRLAASAGEIDRQQAELRWRGDEGEASIEAGRFNGDLGLRALASGGLLIAGERAYATRRVDGSMAVIEVPGHPNVRIYQENRPITRTDNRGRAILANLRAYEENLISIAPADLPIEAHMTYDTMRVVPRFRGAVRARFAVEEERPATLVVAMSEGGAVQTGASARTGLGEDTFVGYGGEIFVREVREGMTVAIETAIGTCTIAVPEQLPRQDIPTIGPLSCISGSADQ